ncbi:IS66 family insertion sequence element accessory protein TnpB [Vibrio vulnificus]
MKRMLSAPNVYLYREFVDFRKSINGLAAIIEAETDLPLGSGALFLFTPINNVIKSKSCTGIKRASLCGINGWKKPNSNGPLKRKNRYTP